MARTRKRKQLGRGYGFGGSILEGAAGSNAGNPQWTTTAGSDCGMSSRGGNNTLSGGKRRQRRRRQRKTRKGGAVALQQPRAGYTFDGSGVAGTPDPVSSPAYVTHV